jgi:hypothetical protein
MNNRKFIIFLLISVAAIIFFSFNKDLYRDKIAGEEINQFSNVNKNFLTKMISDSQFIILYYTEFDCESCISAGYNIINRLFEKNRKSDYKFYIISSSDRIIHDSVLYVNKLPILRDPQMDIKKAIHYISTPVIFFSNEGKDDSCIVVKIKNDLVTEKSIKNVVYLNKLIY